MKTIKQLDKQRKRLEVIKRFGFSKMDRCNLKLDFKSFETNKKRLGSLILKLRNRIEVLNSMENEIINKTNLNIVGSTCKEDFTPVKNNVNFSRNKKLEKLNNQFDKVTLEIEALENEKISLEDSEPLSKEEKRYFKLIDKIYKLDDKQFQIQERIEKIENQYSL